jgi:hypothetical protein
MAIKVRISPQAKFNKLVRDLGRMRPKLVGDRTDKALQTLAEAGKTFIIAGIVNQRANWKQLSEITKRLKGHDRILIDSGSFAGAMEFFREGKSWFAGLPEGAKGNKGKDLELIGEVHEKGASVKVTDKIRAFFFAIGFPLRANTAFITIPARPWFEPAVTEVEGYADKVLEPMLDEILEGIG